MAINVKSVEYKGVGNILIGDSLEQFIDKDDLLMIIDGKFAIFKEQDESFLLCIWPDRRRTLGLAEHSPTHAWVVTIIKERYHAIFLGAGFIDWNWNECYNNSTPQMRRSENFIQHLKTSAVPSVEFYSETCRKENGYDRPKSDTEKDELLNLIRDKVLEIRDESLKNKRA